VRKAWTVIMNQVLKSTPVMDRCTYMSIPLRHVTFRIAFEPFP